MKQEWTPHTFLADHHFCPSGDIHLTVDDIRLACCAKAALTIVVAGSTIYRKLCVFAEDDPTRSDEISQNLQNTSYSLDDGSSVAKLISEVTDVTIPELWCAMLPATFRNAIDIHGESSIVTIHVCIRQPRDIEAALSFRVTWALVLIGTSYSPQPSYLDALDVRINSTVQVITERMNRISDFLDNRIDDAAVFLEMKQLQRPVTVVGSLQPDPLDKYSTLAEVAAKAGFADFCVIYLLPHGQTHLFRAGQYPHDAAIDRMDLEQLSKDSVFGAAWHKKKLLVANASRQVIDASVLEYRRHSSASALCISVIAAPIMSRPFGTDRHNVIGLLVFERHATTPERLAFNYMNLLLTREIASRIEAIHSRLERVATEAIVDAMWEQSARISHGMDDDLMIRSAALSCWVRETAATAVRPRKKDGTVQQDKAARRIPRDARSVPVPPIELWYDLPHLEALLDATRDRLGAAFGTIRLLSTDLSWLIRIVTSPRLNALERDVNWRISTDFPVITAEAARSARVLLAEKSPTDGKWRALNGELIGYKPPPSHKEAVSVICLPLFVGQRVIGTLTYEANSTYALRGSIALSHEFAQMFSRVFEVRNEVVLHNVVALSGCLVRNVHNVKKARDELEKAVKPATEQMVVAKARKALDYLRTIVDYPKTLSEDPFIEQTVAEIVRSAIRASNFRTKTIPLDKRLPAAFRSAVVCREHAHSAMHAIAELLENAHRATASQTQAQTLLDGRLITVFGRTFANVRVSVVNAESVSIEKAGLLYRVPYTDRAGLHLGAYIAGASLRSVGGDVFISRHEPFRLDSIAQIPVR